MHTSMKKTVIALIAAPLLLAGCKSETVVPQPERPDPTLTAIKQAVEQIERQHSILTSVERADNPVAPLPARPTHSPELLEPLHLRNWHGPITEVLAIISGLLPQYTFYVDGHLPAIDPMVNLDSDGRPIFDALASLSDQGGSRYLIRVNTDEKTVALIHRED